MKPFNPLEAVHPIGTGDVRDGIGITKLELFSAMAMQGMCADPQVNDAARCAGAAVKFAKALLAELENESKQ